MHRSISLLVGCILSSLCVAAVAQTPTKRQIDRSFTATSNNCSDVRWSEEMLSQYPDIEAACQAVLERDGKKYIKFDATVRRAHDRGRELDIDVRNGGRVHLRPEGDTNIVINGRSMRIADLQQGDRLTFYVPEDRVEAHFYDEDRTPATAAAQAVTIPMSPARDVEEAQPQERERMAAALPATASALPFLAFVGMLSLGLGGILTMLRLRR